MSRRIIARHGTVLDVSAPSARAYREFRLMAIRCDAAEATHEGGPLRVLHPERFLRLAETFEGLRLEPCAESECTFCHKRAIRRINGNPVCGDLDCRETAQCESDPTP